MSIFEADCRGWKMLQSDPTVRAPDCIVSQLFTAHSLSSSTVLGLVELTQFDFGFVVCHFRVCSFRVVEGGEVV